MFISLLIDLPAKSICPFRIMNITEYKSLTFFKKREPCQCWIYFLWPTLANTHQTGKKKNNKHPKINKLTKQKKNPTGYAGYQHCSGDTLVRSFLTNWTRKPLKQTVRTKLGQRHQSRRLRERVWKAQKIMDCMQKWKPSGKIHVEVDLFFTLSDSWDPAQILYVLHY